MFLDSQLVKFSFRRTAGSVYLTLSKFTAKQKVYGTNHL